jgi:hypothetical protein
MEMMSDSIDDTLDDDEAEEETEELTNQVLPYYHMPVAVIRRSKKMLWMMTYGSERQLLLNLKLPSCSTRTFRSVDIFLLDQFIHRSHNQVAFCHFD